MNVVIVGCGRVGAFLAGMLDQGGHPVTVVDLQRSAFDRLPRGFGGTTILGSGTDLDVLRSAGIEKADAFLSLTQGDNRNLMAAQIAKELFRVSQVLAKCNDPVRAHTYRSRGIYTWSRTTILGTLLHAILTGNDDIGPKLMAETLRHDAELAGDPVAKG